MKREQLTRSHMLDALSQRADTVVGDMHMFLEMLPAYTQPRHGYAVVDRGVIYAVFGIVPMWQGVGEAWMVPTVHLKKRRVAASRHMKIGLDELINYLKVHRTQAAVKVGFKEAHRLVQFVGMENEGLMKKYGPDASDYVRYAKWLT